MKLCNRCPQSGTCLLDYMGKCCKDLRRKNCPDVLLNNYERVTEMGKEEMADLLVAAKDYGPSERYDALDWLNDTAEEL